MNTAPSHARRHGWRRWLAALAGIFLKPAPSAPEKSAATASDMLAVVSAQEPPKTMAPTCPALSGTVKDRLPSTAQPIACLPNPVNSGVEAMAVAIQEMTSQASRTASRAVLIAQQISLLDVRRRRTAGHTSAELKASAESTDAMQFLAERMTVIVENIGPNVQSLHADSESSLAALRKVLELLKNITQFQTVWVHSLADQNLAHHSDPSQADSTTLFVAQTITSQLGASPEATAVLHPSTEETLGRLASELKSAIAQFQVTTRRSDPGLDEESDDCRSLSA